MKYFALLTLALFTGPGGSCAGACCRMAACRGSGSGVPADPAAAAAASRPRPRDAGRAVAAVGSVRGVPPVPAGRAGRCPAWQRMLPPGVSIHCCWAGRSTATALRVPVEEHVVIMAPPRTGKTGLLARMILHYPGPVVSTTTKADVFALTSGIRSWLGPVLVFNPQSIGGVLVHVPLEPGRRLHRRGGGDPPGGRVRERDQHVRHRGRLVLEQQGQQLPARPVPRRRPGRRRHAAGRPVGAGQRPRTPRRSWRRPAPRSGRRSWRSCAARRRRRPPRSRWCCPARWRS